MTMPKLLAVLRHARRVADAEAAHDLTDADLLDRFVSRRDEAAFTLLVERYGPLVMGVCKRQLDDVHDAEDAFQATFLVLVRKAGSIRKRGALGSWLHGVAARVASKARAQARLRAIKERRAAEVPRDDRLDDVTWHELRSVLDEEIARLPERYRAPLILCYFQGKTHEQAARELGWPKSSLSSRLVRARDLLGKGLRRRGVGVSAGILASALARPGEAAVSARLTIGTVRAAALLSGGKTMAAGMLSERALGLAQEAVKAVSSAKLKIAALLLAIAAVTVSAALAGVHVLSRREDPVQPSSTQYASSADAGPKNAEGERLSTTTNRAQLDSKSATAMLESSIQGIWSFDLSLTLTEHTYLDAEYSQQNGSRVHVRNKKLDKPRLIQRVSFRQVYSKGKSRFDFLKVDSHPYVMVCDGEVAKTWSPRTKQSVLQAVSIQLVPEGMDYMTTHRNIIGATGLISCLRERKNITIRRDLHANSLALDIPPLPPETAVALFDMGFRVTVDLDKGFMPSKIEHLKPVAGRLVQRSKMTITDWQKLRNGAYVPARALFQDFDIDPGKGTFGELSADGELAVDVAHSSWNTDIASSECELPLPRGTAVTDMVNHAQYVVANPDPGKNLREMAADFRDLIPLGSVGEEHPRLDASQIRAGLTPPESPFEQTIHLLYPSGKDAIIPELKACDCNSKRVEVRAGKVIADPRDNLGRRLQARREIHVKVTAPSTPQFFEARCKLSFVQGKSESLHYLSIAIPFVGGPLSPRPFRVVFSAAQRAALIGQERLVEVEVDRPGDVVILEGLPPWLEGQVESSRGSIRVIKLKVIKQPPQSLSECTLKIKTRNSGARAVPLPVLVFGQDASPK